MAWIPIPNHVIFVPGPAIATSEQVEVSGYPRDSDPGEFYITTLYQRPATAWWALRAAFQSDWTMVSEPGEAPRSLALQPRDDDHSLLREVVYQTCGIEPTTRVTVLDLTPDSPLQGQVHPGDIIVRVNGLELHQVRQLRERIALQVEGTPTSLELLRPDGSRLSIKALPKPIAGLDSRHGLGVLLSTRLDTSNLPRIHFRAGAYQGNSSDLMLALDLCERLLRLQLRRGRKVAGSGGLAGDGSLTSVGGLVQKLTSARQAGATIFLVPAQDAPQLAGTNRKGPQVVPIHSLNEAIYFLQKSQL